MQDDNSDQIRFLITALKTEQYILVHIIPTIEGVDIPSHVKNLPVVTLRVSVLFKGKTEILEDRIVTDLLFNGKYYTCILPFNAMIGFSTGNDNHYFWKDPKTGEDIKTEKTLSSKQNKTKPKKKKDSSHLKRVK